jgi:hypothetical protein
LKNFLGHHQEISVTTPEGLQSPEQGVRISTSVFQIHKPAMQNIQQNSARLYNCDETGITIVQHKRAKILELKGKI